MLMLSKEELPSSSIRTEEKSSLFELLLSKLTRLLRFTSEDEEKEAGVTVRELTLLRNELIDDPENGIVDGGNIAVLAVLKKLIDGGEGTDFFSVE